MSVLAGRLVQILIEFVEKRDELIYECENSRVLKNVEMSCLKSPFANFSQSPITFTKVETIKR